MATEHSAILFSLSPFTGSRLTYQVHFIQQPRKNTWSCSTFLRLPTEFGAMTFCRNCPRSDFFCLSYQGHQASSVSEPSPSELMGPRPTNSFVPRSISPAYPLSFILRPPSIHYLQPNPLFCRLNHFIVLFLSAFSIIQTSTSIMTIVSLKYLQTPFWNSFSWGSNNHDTFNSSKTAPLLISFKRHSLSPPLSFGFPILTSADCFSSRLIDWFFTVLVLFHIWAWFSVPRQAFLHLQLIFVYCAMLKSAPYMNTTVTSGM